MGKTTKKIKKLRRVRLFPRSGIFAPVINNRPPRNWDLGYEIVVSFHYGLDEDNIRSVIGLRNCDTGIELSTNRRDLMFPCGAEKTLAHSAAGRLVALDLFGALKVKISYPVVHIGKDSFTLWYSADGKLLEMIATASAYGLDVNASRSAMPVLSNAASAPRSTPPKSAKQKEKIHD